MHTIVKVLSATTQKKTNASRRFCNWSVAGRGGVESDAAQHLASCQLPVRARGQEPMAWWPERIPPLT